MVKAKIKSIEPQVIVATGERYLDVALEIVDGKETKELKLGFPIDTTKEDILEEAKKQAENYQLEKAQRATQEVADAHSAHVAELQDLQGEEIAAPELEDAEAETTKGAKNNGSKNTTKKRG